jgi:membrane-associated phospholipid phosphatase
VPAEQGHKDLWQVERPCRTLADVATIAACPEHGDWSFPSTHATIAGAAAVAIVWSGARVAYSSECIIRTMSSQAWSSAPCSPSPFRRWHVC